MQKRKIVLSLTAVVAVAIAAILFSSFSSPEKAEAGSSTLYYWYVVSYDVPEGRIPSGASPVFGGAQASKADAQANDGCPDSGSKHCLRGFTSIPALPTTSYHESTPKP